MVGLRQGEQAGMEPDRNLPPAAGCVISFKMRVSYTGETDGTGYFAWGGSIHQGVIFGWTNQA